MAQHTDWHQLAEQASKEMDSAKLLNLVDELNRALQQNEQTSKRLENESF
jgi:RNA polymerase-binding transcription factor DksA